MNIIKGFSPKEPGFETFWFLYVGRNCIENVSFKWTGWYEKYESSTGKREYLIFYNIKELVLGRWKPFRLAHKIN